MICKKVFLKNVCYLSMAMFILSGCNKKQQIDNIIYEKNSNNQQTNTKNNNEKSRKKVAIITDPRQGGGLLMIANGYKNALEEKYDVVIIDMLKDRMFFENVFPYCSRTQSWFTLKTVIELNKLADFLIAIPYYNAIKTDLMKINPDLIISASPVMNSYYWKIAKELNKPLWISPTDYNHDDIKLLGIPDLTKETQYKDNFKLLMYVNDTNNEKLSKYGIKVGKNLTYIQFPVRREFLSFVYDYYDKKQSAINELLQLKQEYNIGKNDRSLFISLGANTFMADVITNYINIIDNALEKNKKFDGKLIIFVACGNNKELKKKLMNYPIKSKDIIIKPIGWLDGKGMAKYELLADAVIIKPGGNSFTEGLTVQQNKFFIYSDSTYAMKWERSNIERAREYGSYSELKYTWEKDYVKDLENKLFNRLNNNEDIKTKKEFPRSNFYKVVLEEADKILDNNINNNNK